MAQTCVGCRKELERGDMVVRARDQEEVTHQQSVGHEFIGVGPIRPYHVQCWPGDSDWQKESGRGPWES